MFFKKKDLKPYASYFYKHFGDEIKHVVGGEHYIAQDSFFYPFYCALK